MNDQELEKIASLLLSEDERAVGFSIVADSQNNIILLKNNNRIAWFSKVLSIESLKVSINVIKAYESEAVFPV